MTKNKKTIQQAFGILVAANAIIFLEFYRNYIGENKIETTTI